MVSTLRSLVAHLLANWLELIRLSALLLLLRCFIALAPSLSGIVELYGLGHDVVAIVVV
jgi:hypothetical protein